MANYTFIFQAQADAGVAFFCQKGAAAPYAPSADVPVQLIEGDTVSFMLLPAAGTTQTMASIELSFTPKEGGTRKDEILMPFFIAPVGGVAPAPTNIFLWSQGDADAILVQTKCSWTFVGKLLDTQQNVYNLTDPEMQVGEGG